MLPQPADYDHIDDITIYADAETDYAFCLVPNIPTLGFGQDSQPICMLLQYREVAGDIQENEARGGGYVQFEMIGGVDITTWTPELSGNPDRDKFQKEVIEGLGARAKKFFLKQRVNSGLHRY